MLQDDLVKVENKTIDAFTVALSRRDAETMFTAVLNPPPANTKLREALAEHERRVVSR